jgi:hypothetical protein
MHSLQVFKVCLWQSAFHMTLQYTFHISTSCLNTDLSLASHCHPKTIACCVLSENLPQFDFREFAHHPLEMNISMILNGPTSINPVDINQMSMEARQLVHLYASIDQETFDSGTCWQRDSNVWECHHTWSAVLDEWSVTLRPGNLACCFPRKLSNSAL